MSPAGSYPGKRPGNEKGELGDFYKGEYGDRRLVWLESYTVQVTVYHGERNLPEPRSASQIGPDTMVILRWKQLPTKLKLYLSEMTEAELDAFKDLMNEAIEISRPVCRMRDEAVHKEFHEEGKDANERLYRAVPRLVRRKGQEQEHGKGIPG